jgi:hypothetical protein
MNESSLRFNLELYSTHASAWEQVEFILHPSYFILCLDIYDDFRLQAVGNMFDFQFMPGDGFDFGVDLVPHEV